MNDSKITQENQGNPALCPELRTTDLIPPFDTVSMKPQKTTEKAKSESLWTKAPVANLVRYEPSGIYFVRAKVRGKLIRKSLDTNVLSVAKQRLADVLDAERRSVAPRNAKIVGKMTFAAGLAPPNSALCAATYIFLFLATMRLGWHWHRRRQIFTRSADSELSTGCSRTIIFCGYRFDVQRLSPKLGRFIGDGG